MLRAPVIGTWTEPVANQRALLPLLWLDRCLGTSCPHIPSPSAALVFGNELLGELIFVASRLLFFAESRFRRLRELPLKPLHSCVWLLLGPVPLCLK